MKKIFAFVLAIIFVVSVIYEYKNIVYGGADRNLETTTSYETTTAQRQNSNDKDNKNTDLTKSLEIQLYENLTENEKEAYNTILEAMRNHKSSTTVSPNIDNDRIFDIVHLICYCHPELFWVKNNGTYYSDGKFVIDYLYSKKEAKEIQPLIEQRAREIIEKIGPSDDEYTLSLAIYDYIVKSTIYNDAAAENHDEYPRVSTIEGVILDGTAVCGGYSKAYQYLLSLVGIDAITITGYAYTPTEPGYHAWVAQKVNGEIYLSDPTWGDGYEESGHSDFVNHAYFLMSSAEIEKTHQCDELYKNIRSTYERDNYFVKQNTYFEKYDQASISNALKTCIENNESAVQLKFANEQECQKAKEDLIDNLNIHSIFKTVDPSHEKIDASKATYNIDDTHNIITVFYN